MESKNFFLPHGGHATAFPRPRTKLAAGVVTFISPLSLLIKASLIQQDLLEDSTRCASTLPGPHLWFETEVVIIAYPLSLLVVTFLIHHSLLEVSHESPHSRKAMNKMHKHRRCG